MSDGKLRTDSGEVITCGVCDRPVVSVEEAPFTVSDGDCIMTEDEVELRTEERSVIGLKIIRHADEDPDDG